MCNSPLHNVHRQAPAPTSRRDTLGTTTDEVAPMDEPRTKAMSIQSLARTIEHSLQTDTPLRGEEVQNLWYDPFLTNAINPFLAHLVEYWTDQKEDAEGDINTVGQQYLHTIKDPDSSAEKIKSLQDDIDQARSEQAYAVRNLRALEATIEILEEWRG